MSDEPAWPAGWKETRDAEQQDRLRNQDSPDQAPSVGRVVHYVPLIEPGCLAAIIVKVTDDGATLTVFNPLPSNVISACRYGSGGEPGSWHWPERV